MLSLVVTAIGAYEGTRAIQEPPAPVAMARPDPSGVDLLVEAAKTRPATIDEFERETAKMIREARERMARK